MRRITSLNSNQSRKRTIRMVSADPITGRRGDALPIQALHTEVVTQSRPPLPSIMEARNRKTVKPRPALQCPKIHIVGGGVTGLMAAIDLAAIAIHYGIKILVSVYEADVFGGGRDDHTAAPRCQLWRHDQGQLFAPNQPSVSLALQESTRRLKEIAPYAFASPLALAIEPPSCDGPSIAQSFRAIGVEHWEVPMEVFQRWFPALVLPDGCHVYRVTDGTIDLRLLSYSLKSLATRLGIEFVRQRVLRIRSFGDVVKSFDLDDGNRVEMAASDQLVLTCGAGIRPLLSTLQVVMHGLRHFQSRLIATDAIGLPALLAVAHGGVNCVPHYGATGQLLNVFGNSARMELPIEEDHRLLRLDINATKRLRDEVEEWFGIRIPMADQLRWPAVKTEIVSEGRRSQAHHACCVPGFHNVWLAIPGKLSQAAACSLDLACKIARQLIDEPLPRPLWETLAVTGRVANHPEGAGVVD